MLMPRRIRFDNSRRRLAKLSAAEFEYNRAVGGERPITARDEAITAEVERILESNTFRNSDALRRLLKFLADKMLSGEADQLKEYSVGLDALGKPATYDPRHDSTVRIQVGRLRQKLAEYYRTEGKEDRLIVDLPKGRFKLTCEESAPVAAVSGNGVYAGTVVAPAEPSPSIANVHLLRSRGVLILLSVALLAALAWGAFATVRLSRARQDAAPLPGM